MTNTKILFCPDCLVDNPEIKYHGEGNGIECMNCNEFIDEYLEDEVRLFGAEKIEDWKNTTDQKEQSTKQLPNWLAGYSLVCYGCNVTSHPSDDQAKPTEACECHNLVLCEICYYRLHHENEDNPHIYYIEDIKTVEELGLKYYKCPLCKDKKLGIKTHMTRMHDIKLRRRKI